MVTWRLKLWSGVGAAALAACGPTSTPAPEPAIAVESGEAAIGESGGEGGGAMSVYAGLSGDQRIALRLQHLKGYVLIAQRLADSDRAAEAGALVQQGLLEAHDIAPTEFGTLDVARVRAAGDGAHASAAQMSQKLNAANAAIDAARRPLASNHADLAVRLVDLAAALYRNAAQPEAFDPLEYQHSLGAALSARDALTAGAHNLRGQNAHAYDEALAELDRFIALFPSADAPENPATYQDVLRQSSRVRLTLSAFL